MQICRPASRNGTDLCFSLSSLETHLSRIALDLSRYERPHSNSYFKVVPFRSILPTRRGSHRHGYLCTYLQAAPPPKKLGAGLTAQTELEGRRLQAILMLDSTMTRRYRTISNIHNATPTDFIYLYCSTVVHS